MGGGGRSPIDNANIRWRARAHGVVRRGKKRKKKYRGGAAGVRAASILTLHMPGAGTWRVGELEEERLGL